MLERVGTIPIHITSEAPLASSDGVEVLFWIRDGSIRVHPERVEIFRRLVIDGVLSIPVPV